MSTAERESVLTGCPVVPVVVLEHAEQAVPLAEALLAGGIDVMEITLRTGAGLDALRRVATEVPAMRVGAGTVLTPAHVDAVTEAGARFVVSPGLAVPVLDRCDAVSVPALPGVATASELMAATARGLTEVKVFPAGPLGGPSVIAALSAPFPEVRFMPSGGVSADTMADYLALRCVPAVSGSWMVAADLLAEHRFDEVTRRSAAAVRTARGIG